jgi:hypothetical protein
VKAQPWIARFWALVDKGPDGEGHGPRGCWLWTGCINERGYGRFKIAGRVEKAHRLACVLRHGRAGSVTMHDCDVRGCVRHVSPGTHKRNMRDMVRKGRWNGPRGDGHPFKGNSERARLMAAARWRKAAA